MSKDFVARCGGQGSESEMKSDHPQLLSFHITVQFDDQKNFIILIKKFTQFFNSELQRF